MPHTEGPWRVEEKEERIAVVLEKSGEKMPDGFIWLPVAICRVGEGVGRSREQALANARLIAAAPELLAALEALLAEARTYKLTTWALSVEKTASRASDAIAAAKGV